jgi:hypothetical protein
MAGSRFANRRGLYMGRRATKPHVALYRISRGRLANHLPGLPAARILLLDHTGAKTGLKRTSPVMYYRDWNLTAVAASQAGQPTKPGLRRTQPGSEWVPVLLRRERGHECDGPIDPAPQVAFGRSVARRDPPPRRDAAGALPRAAGSRTLDDHGADRGSIRTQEAPTKALRASSTLLRCLSTRCVSLNSGTVAGSAESR